MVEATVTLRKEKRSTAVNITHNNKPEISDDILEKWQNLVDLVAELFAVPAGLIMKITPTDMAVFRRSSGDHNPYQVQDNDALGHGLYCETVIGQDGLLHVANAHKDAAWKDNPDIKLAMISYLGLPLKWSDHEVFGTLCVLDRRERYYDEKQLKLMTTFKTIIETDLHLLESNHQLNVLANTDPLTNIPNRNHMRRSVHAQMDAYRKEHQPFALAMLDLDGFKAINDAYGHRQGDLVLVRFASFLKTALADTIFISRYGGDEFLLVFPKMTSIDAEAICLKLQHRFESRPFFKTYHLSFTYGLVDMDDPFKDETDILDAADKQMMQRKKRKKNTHA